MEHGDRVRRCEARAICVPRVGIAEDIAHAVRIFFAHRDGRGLAFDANLRPVLIRDEALLLVCQTVISNPAKARFVPEA
jgi:hypothetical protein